MPSSGLFILYWFMDNKNNKYTTKLQGEIWYFLKHFEYNKIIY